MNRRSLLKYAGVAVGGPALAGCADSPATETPDDQPSRFRPDGRTPREPTTRSETDAETETETEPSSVDRPIVFNPPAKIETIRQKVDAGEQPWARAFEELLEDAGWALEASPRSVVDNGAPAGTDDAHKYGSDAPYQSKDGVYSDDVNRGDYQAALDMKDWIRDAALAYRLTREDEYARTAIDLLRAWFIDSETRMHPSVVNYGPHSEGLKGQNSIEHYIFVPAMVYGAALVADHPYWEAGSGPGESGVTEWLEEFQETLEDDANGGVESDEISKWWVTTRLIVAAYLEDDDAFERACDDWRTRVLQDFTEQGTFEKDRPRSRGLFYSLSAMNALTLGAEVAGHHGVDLYGYTKDGMSESVLQRSHQFHAEFLEDPSEWPWEERNGLDDNERMYGTVSYELCYSRWQTDAYWDAIEATGRPVYDWRVLGYTTLTHGDLFELEY